MRSTARGVLANAVRGGAVAAVILTLLFAAAELALRPFMRVGLSSNRSYPRGYFTRDAYGISKANPGHWHVVTRSFTTGDVLYDVDYTIDRFGKRVTPVPDAASHDKFAMFFGCSFTMGEGVEDDETLPYYVGQLAPEYMPYNYGFHGGGPFDALARLDTIDFGAEVAEQHGVGVYVFIDDHVNRVADSSTIAFWHGNEVYYDRDPDGRLVRNGSFKTARPLRSKVYRLVHDSRVLQLLGIGLPPRITPDAFDLTAAVLVAIDQRFRAHFPGSEFYVAFYPSAGYARALIPRLDAAGVRHLDYRQLFSRADPRYRVSDEDRHPSAEAHRTLAAAIVRDLRLDAPAQVPVDTATASPASATRQ